MSRSRGQHYEEWAKKYILDRGYIVLEQNYTTKYGEIDLIALNEHKDTLIFFEVKYRASSSHGHAVEYVTPQKIAKLKRAMWHYIHRFACHLPPNFRLDIIAIEGNEAAGLEVTHIEAVPTE